MYLYCERVLFDNKKQAYEVIFDFNKWDDVNKFAESIKFEFYNNNSSQSLLSLDGVIVESYKGPRPGKWYDIPISFFKENFEQSNEGIEEFGNRLIAFSLTMKNKKKLNFQQYKPEDKEFINEKLYMKNTEPVDFVDTGLYKHIKSYKGWEENENECLQNLKLIVRNVGCGNWNEVIGERFRLIYDLGGDVKFNNLEMSNIIANANLVQPFYAIISHWDLDHYRAILDLDDPQLKLMQNIVVPSKRPNNVQLNKALDRLYSLGISMDTISPPEKVGREIKLISRGKVKNFELFRSVDGANINQSGIALVIEGDRKTGILTGDHHYPQIYNGILSRATEKPYEFVVPHHGGNAGKFDLNIWSSIPFASGALSTRSGRYKNLPQVKIHDFFVRNNFFHCTDCRKSDYITTL